MFYTKKVKDELRQREDDVVEFLLNELDLKIQSSKKEVLDVVFATAMSAKVKPKAIIGNMSPDKTREFAEDLYDALGQKIKELQEKAIKDLQKSGVKAKKSICAPCGKSDYRL